MSPTRRTQAATTLKPSSSAWRKPTETPTGVISPAPLTPPPKPTRSCGSATRSRNANPPSSLSRARGDPVGKIAIYEDSFKADADMRTKQYEPVKLSSTAGSMSLVTGATDRMIGILQDKPNQYEE